LVIRLTLPLGKEDNVKNLIFSILTNEYPLKIIEITNIIKNRYGKSVTFQAVRKALFDLMEEEIVLKHEKEFSINKNWVFEAREELDKVYRNLTEERAKPNNLDSIQGEISVFSFDSLSEMMRFWQSIINDWFDNFQAGNPNINAYQGAHVWEGLLYTDKERIIMNRLKDKGIKCYALSVGKTPLDKYIWKFYKSLGIKTGFSHSNSSFDKGYYVATYGETVVQAKYPQKLVVEIDNFFKKNKKLEDLNLQKLSELVNQKIKIKLTVIKNLEMAKQINKSIIQEID